MAHPHAGLWLTMLQERWAQAVLCGAGIANWKGRLPREIRLQLIVDFGWTHLWRQAQASAITVHMKMQLDAKEWQHAAVENIPDLPVSFWQN